MKRPTQRGAFNCPPNVHLILLIFRARFRRRRRFFPPPEPPLEADPPLVAEDTLPASESLPAEDALPTEEASLLRLLNRPPLSARANKSACPGGCGQCESLCDTSYIALVRPPSF